MLILCGSLVGFVEREVLGARSPLYGRRRASVRLEPNWSLLRRYGAQEAFEHLVAPQWVAIGAKCAHPSRGE